MKKLFILLSFLIMALCFTAQAKADSSWTFSVNAYFSGNYELNEYPKEEYKGEGLVMKTTEYFSHSNTQFSWGVNTYDEITGAPGTKFFSHLYLSVNGGTGNYMVGDDPWKAIEFWHVNNQLPRINGDELLPYPKLMEIFLEFTFQNTENENLAYRPVVPLTLGFIETDNAIQGRSSDDFFFFLYPEALRNPTIVGDYTISFDTGFGLMDQSSEYYQLAFDTLGAKEGDEIWGWRTNEGITNKLPISFVITERGVVDTPEPASMLFLGGSLAGFGLLRRFRMKRKQNA